MKIIIITQGISRVVKPLIASKFEIIGIIESAPRSKGKRILGLKNLVKSSFSFLHKKNSLSSFSKGRKIPYFYLTKDNTDKLVIWLNNLQPDILVVHLMSQLLKESIYNLPKFGTINLHGSYLPEYRGPNPDLWQYFDLVENPGCTVHFIDKGEDTGDIIIQERIHIPLGTKSPERLDLLIGKLGVKLLMNALDSIEHGNVKRYPQPQVSPTKRARNLRPEEHKVFIDWENWEILKIWNILRGTEVWLNALEQPRGIMKGQRWSIGNYEVITNKQEYEISKIYREKGHYFITCKGYKINLSIDFRISRFIKYIIS